MSKDDRVVPGDEDAATAAGPGGPPAAGGGLTERESPPPGANDAGRTIILQPAPAPGGSGTGGGAGGGQPGPQRQKGVPRPLFWVVLSLFLVSLLVIAGLVVTRPSTGKAVALRTPAPGVSSPGASAPASSSPGAGSGGGSAAAASTTPTASAPAPASVAPPPASGTSLFTQQPVQANDAQVVNGAVAIGTTSYPNSIRYTCFTGTASPSTVVYDVAGFAFLNATLGVPSDATNAAGNTMSVTFFKDGSTDQLGKTLTISLDNPVALHLNLDGASQLSIDCAATKSSGDTPASMDLAFGNAVLNQS